MSTFPRVLCELNHFAPPRPLAMLGLMQLEGNLFPFPPSLPTEGEKRNVLSLYALLLDDKCLIQRRLLVPDKGLKEDRRFSLLSRRFP